MKLLVEGATEERLIPELVEAQRIRWTEAEVGDKVPYIDDVGGVENILKSGTISAEFKASGLRRLGVIVDANGNASGRWQSIRRRCESELPDMVGLPERIPEAGFVRERQDGSWFGVWIMPDNRSSGALEEFLLGLVPSTGEELLTHARSSVDRARELGAELREVDVAKSVIHTWLAWQRDPGPQLHEAVKRRLLDPRHPASQLFVSWFRSMFLP